MEYRNAKPIIGLLGGIGSGKSAVAAEFAKLGCAVIDADTLAKNFLEQEPYKARICEQFGFDILKDDGTIDRKSLAKVAFSSTESLEALTNILHPPVLEQTQALIDTYLKQDTTKAIVLDVPLLAEVGQDKQCDVLIFVQTDDEIRNQRAQARGMSKKELQVRENFQISLDIKAKMADYIVNNNSDLTVLAEQVSRIFNRILVK